jgi:hypothetical protein
MEKVFKRAELLSQVTGSRQQQDESNERATYVGWTVESMSEYEKRANFLALLVTRLAVASGDWLRSGGVIAAGR